MVTIVLQIQYEITRIKQRSKDKVFLYDVSICTIVMFGKHSSQLVKSAVDSVTFLDSQHWTVGITC